MWSFEMHFGICLPNSAVKIVKKIGYGRQREHFCENYDLKKTCLLTFNASITYY